MPKSNFEVKRFSTKPRRVRRRALFLCCLTIGALCILLFLERPVGKRPRATFCYDLAQQIQPGMSYEEVLGVLGIPPGDYRTRPSVYIMPHMDSFSRNRGWRGWSVDQGRIEIQFNEENRVNRVVYMATLSREKSILDRLKQLIGEGEE
jgi:hypothetical protein